MSQDTFRGPLHQMASTTATDFWNDSCAVGELQYALEHGAVGATSNPTIVHQVLLQELDLWRPRICQLIEQHGSWSEERLTWELIEQMAVHGAGLLSEVFERHQGRKGRLSIQTNPAHYGDAEAITRQAMHFHRLAANMQVKIPATAAGLVAIERATAAGVNVNATVCFTVAQALAVAQAVERGLQQRQEAGHEVALMTPICTIMVGRLDDWLKVACQRDGLVTTPGELDWAGVACIKKAHALYGQRGYRTRLLAAAYRSHLHWTELVGGDLVLTIPAQWQRLFNASGMEPAQRFERPVEPGLLQRLERLPEFRLAYDEQGLTPQQFDSYGATVRTLRTFIASYHDLVGQVRDLMLPDPDLAAGGAS